MTEDTIAAISTPIGEGGIAIIRVSGPKALTIADQIFMVPAGKPSGFPTHTIHFGRLTRAGKTIDHALLSIMRAPRSYTMEDTVEFNCHGGMLIARTVLTLCLESGARLAEPGEFTKRAFLNGRLDLTQAEAVMDLISAKTDRARFAATNALEGHLAKRIEDLRERLMTVLAHIEAQIDFPEDDITPATRVKLLSEVRDIRSILDQLLSTSREGKILRQGYSIAIVGRPNAGKSSLMNLLLGEDRSIVTPMPGTTRDTIDEFVNIRGIPIRLTDTAGIRSARGVVESIGINRTRKVLLSSDMVIHVIDRSRKFSDLDIQLSSLYAGKPSLIAINKIDLKSAIMIPETLSTVNQISISCMTGIGKDCIEIAIEREIFEKLNTQSIAYDFVINERHSNAILRSIGALNDGIIDMEEEASMDIIAQSFRIALQNIGEIVGRTSTEDLLSSIFSKFCIGK